MTDINIHIESKHYQQKSHSQNKQTIANFNLSLVSGEFTCLVGPSGCGKTTLLNILADLDNDFQGEIMLGKQHKNPNIGYVFQNPRLLPWRTVRENIELALNHKLADEQIDFLLKNMQLSHIKDMYPEHLSLGMSRRVSIIRAFAVNPDILLMDEPFVSLDAPTARQIRNLLIKLWQQRPHTVLFVTHDLREAIALADRLIFLSASPMQIISDIKVPIARELRNDESVIESFRQKLAHQHPEINQLL